MNENNINNQVLNEFPHKKTYLIYGIVLLVMILLGSTYAYFSISGEDNDFGGNMGNVDLAKCVLLVRSKKKLYDVISNDPNRPGTLVEFVLLGEVGTSEIVNQAIHNEYKETAKDINDAKQNYY